MRVVDQNFFCGNYVTKLLLENSSKSRPKKPLVSSPQESMRLRRYRTNQNQLYQGNSA
jgi:hypothetical protein